jgi:hypothetical protein
VREIPLIMFLMILDTHKNNSWAFYSTICTTKSAREQKLMGKWNLKSTANSR